MDQDQQPLDEEDFDLAATRPPITLGLPHKLSVALLTATLLVLIAYDTGDLVNDLIVDAVFVGAIAIVWSTAKMFLRDDYHGWDIFVSWLTLDARLPDTKEWGGSHISSFPLRSIYRCDVGGTNDVE